MAKNSGKPKRRNDTIWWVTGVAVAAVGLLVGVSIYTSKPEATAGSSATSTAATSGTQVAAKSDADLGAVRNVKGADAAKVKVVEFGDFQ